MEKLFKTPEQYYAEATGPAASTGLPTSSKIALDTYNAIWQLGTNGFGFPSQLRKEIEADGDVFDIADELQGQVLRLIVGEDTDGNPVVGSQLVALVDAATAAEFNDRLQMTYALTGDLEKVVLSFPVIAGTDLQITLNPGHNIARLHLYYLPGTNTENPQNMKSKNVTTDLTAATPKVITHNLSYQARNVTFADSTGTPIVLDWIATPGNVTNAITVTSTVDLSDVTISIIAF